MWHEAWAWAWPGVSLSHWQASSSCNFRVWDSEIKDNDTSSFQKLQPAAAPVIHQLLHLQLFFLPNQTINFTSRSTFIFLQPLNHKLNKVDFIICNNLFLYHVNPKTGNYHKYIQHELCPDNQVINITYTNYSKSSYTKHFLKMCYITFLFLTFNFWLKIQITFVSLIIDLRIKEIKCRKHIKQRHERIQPDITYSTDSAIRKNYLIWNLVKL